MPRRRPRRRGQPLALGNEETEKRLLDAVRGGVPLNHAATYAGIGQRTLYRTLARGEDAAHRLEDGEKISRDDEICHEVWAKVARARSEVAVRNVALVQRAAQGGALTRRTTRTMRDGSQEVSEEFAAPDHRAAVFLLKMFPEFRAPDELQVTGAGGGPVRVEVDDATSRAADRVREVVAARRAELESGQVIEGELDDG